MKFKAFQYESDSKKRNISEYELQQIMADSSNKYVYTPLVPVKPLEVHYFPEGAVAFTDLRNANRLPDGFVPYGAIAATELHERLHIYNAQHGKEQDEAKINRTVLYILRLDRFPFASYHDPFFY